MSAQPAALQLRYLQSMREIATERNSMTILPLPIDLISPFVEMAKRHNAKAEAEEKLEKASAEAEEKREKAKSAPKVEPPPMPAASLSATEETLGEFSAIDPVMNSAAIER